MKMSFNWLRALFSDVCAILREVNSDEGGSLSQMRICGFMVVTVILGVFVWKNMQTTAGTMVDFPDNAGYIVASVILGKVAQKYVERKWHSTAENISEDVAARTQPPEEPCPKAFKE